MAKHVAGSAGGDTEGGKEAQRHNTPSERRQLCDDQTNAAATPRPFENCTTRVRVGLCENFTSGAKGGHWPKLPKQEDRGQSESQVGLL